MLNCIIFSPNYVMFSFQQPALTSPDLNSLLVWTSKILVASGVTRIVNSKDNVTVETCSITKPNWQEPVCGLVLDQLV